MSENFKRENREIPKVSNSSELERSANASGGTADMYAVGKSDGSIVPSTRANKAATAVAESVEERESPKRSHIRFDIVPDTVPELCDSRCEPTCTAGSDENIVTVITQRRSRMR